MAVLFLGGLVLIWKGIKEMRVKAKGTQQEVQATDRFHQVVAVIVGMNLLLSVDSIVTVVGMTDVFSVDFYQNRWEAKVRRRAPAPLTLRRGRK